MSFGFSGKKDDVSLKLRAQNMKNARKQTSELEVDNRKMEERLQELKLALNNEKEEREQSQGGFWRAGQQGNLGNYASEVLSKPSKQERNKEKKKKVIKVLKDEPIVTPERKKGPGTVKYIADRRSAGGAGGKENHEKIKGSVCGQCETKAAHVSCLECGEDYCASCFAAFHMKGALKKHRSVPLGASGARTPRGMMMNDRSPQSPPDERATPTDVNLIMDSSRSSARSSARLSATSTTSYSSKNNNNRAVIPRPPAAPKQQPSPPLSAITTNNNYDDDDDKYYADDNDTSSNNSNESAVLLEGAYDEREAAADFQRALAEWRTGKKEKVQPAVAVQRVETPVYNIDEGTGTDSIYESQQPMDIKFHGTLTYAEKLMLKRHRRHQLGPVDGGSSISSTSPEGSSSNSAASSARIGLKGRRIGMRSYMDEDEDRPYLFNDVEVLNQDALNSEVAASRVDIGVLLGSVKRPYGEEYEQERSESRVSIIELGTAENRRSLRGLESTTRYEVTELEDDEIVPPPTPSALAMAKSNKFWEPREAFKTPHASAKYPRTEPVFEPPPATTTTTTSETSKTKPPSSARRTKSGNKSIKKNNSSTWQQEDSLNSMERDINNTEVAATTSSSSSQILRGDNNSNKPPPPKSARGQKSRPQSRLKSARGEQRSQSRAKSRAESRLSLFGEGVITKEPSEALKEIASLARQVTSDIVANSEYKLGLGDFFTAGVESPVDDKMGEEGRTLTPTKNRPVSARNRPMSARSNRPKSSMGKKDSEAGDIEKWKISNKLYSMTPRSWKPEFSLADTVPDSQAQDHLTDESVLNMDRLAEETMASLAKLRAGEDDLVLYEVGITATMTTATKPEPKEKSNITIETVKNKGAPKSARKSTDKQSTRPKSKTGGRVTPVCPPSRPTTASGRESRMIVMEGEDLSLYDHVEEQDPTVQDDNAALDQLEWELASESGRLTADGRVSRLIDENDMGDNDDQQYEPVHSSKPKDIGFDIQNHLRASELMDDFEEMEAIIMEEEEVKRLI